MKALSLGLLPVLVAFMFAEATSATISGNISYAGSQTGKLMAAVFTDSTFQGDPIAKVAISSPGSYTITGLSDGIYYAISVLETDTSTGLKSTDPWGVYGTLTNPTRITITGGADVSGIDITMTDGTAGNPNPWADQAVNLAQPQLTIQLPSIIDGGSDKSIASDGSSIYLARHDTTGSSSEEIFEIDPNSGKITTTYNVSLISLANGISWISRMTFYKGAIWVAGGYGDPSGSGQHEDGVFRIDPTTSLSSDQLLAGADIGWSDNEQGGLANDGTSLYIGVDPVGSDSGTGIVKFDPTQVSAVPASPLWVYSGKIPSYLVYGDSCLWAGWHGGGIDKIDPSNGTVLASYTNLPDQAASVYLNGMLWMYSDSDNTLKAYSPEATGVQANKQSIVSSFQLSQNYPNPFNPTTMISYQLPVNSVVVLKVFDILGREVATLVNGRESAGSHYVSLDAANLPSGVYFYRIIAEGNSGRRFVAVKKLLLLK